MSWRRSCEFGRADSADPGVNSSCCDACWDQLGRDRSTSGPATFLLHPSLVRQSSSMLRTSRICLSSSMLSTSPLRTWSESESIRNPLTLRSVPVLVHVQVWVHIPGDPQSVQLRNATTTTYFTYLPVFFHFTYFTYYLPVFFCILYSMSRRAYFTYLPVFHFTYFTYFASQLQPSNAI